MKNTQQGFTIIELMITVAVLSFGIIGIYSVFSPIIAQTSIISSRVTASYLAQEGLEIVRNLRDNGQTEKLLNCKTGCQLNYKTATPAQESTDSLKPYNNNEYLKINTDGFYAYEGTPTKFKREVIVAQFSTDILEVKVSVLWDYNGAPYHFDLQENLYNFK